MTTSAPASAATAWKPTDRWLAGIVLSVITFWLFAQTLLNVIPGIQGELGIAPTIANLAVSITSLFSGIFIVVAGGLADRVGRGRILMIGIGLSIVGSLLIALTPEGMGGLTAGMLLAGRIVQGLSAACIMPSSMALVKSFYDGKKRQRALSFWSIGSWGGSGFCALFGGLMATSPLGWRSIFWISIALSVLALFLVRDTPVSKAPASANAGGFDWLGLITFIVTILALNIYISQGPNIGWMSPIGLGLIVVTVVCGLWFLQIETHRMSAFIDLSLFRNGTFTGATLSNFLLNGAAGTLIVSLGIGLGFYATPSTDAALSNVPEAQVGAAAGIYKMASSLGSAIGVAVSAALYVAGQTVSPEFVQSWGLFIGRQDNIALRFGGAIGLLFNVAMVVIALASIILTVPSQKKVDTAEGAKDAPEGRRDVAPPPIGN